MSVLVALVLAMTLVLSVASVALADGNTLTINRDSSYNTTNGSGNAVYYYTKILRAENTGTLPTVNAESGAWSGTAGNVVYFVTDANQATALASTSVFTVASKSSDNRYYVTSTETNGATIASAIDTMLSDATYATYFTTTSKASDGETTQITGLADGYYFIKASNGNKLAVQTLGDVTINEKNTYPTIEKTEADPEIANDTYDKAANIGVGDIVNYKVSVTVPADASKLIYVTDTMSTGLTFNKGGQHI